ncbi:MAG TPA: HD-GYP domain-containing protein [Candidatus Limnocylindria bacterium]|nr:HD-GYP domain-containing protein [Candidatus Limnocylindria bacterium]
MFKNVDKTTLVTPYIATVGILGAAALGYSVTALPTQVDPVMLVVLMGIAAIAQRLPVFLFKSSAISVAFAATIASYVLYGPAVALWVNLTSALVNCFTPTRKPLKKMVFNVGNLTISAFLAAHAYRLFGGQVPPADIPQSVVAVALSASIYFLANSAMTAFVITLTTQNRFMSVWRENYSWMTINYLATAVNGAALAFAYQSLNVFGTVTFMLPLAVAWYSFKLYMAKSSEVRLRNADLVEANRMLQLTNDRLEQSHLSVIGALLGALEAKDRYTHGHSSATMFHAVTVARELGLSEDEVAAVQLGALFHDIGKIGIPEQILRKPERLTDEEWAEMKMHPVIGANLLAHVPTLEKVRPIILAHHERYDGSGYPNGLKGDEIPLAAQIIAVADTFEAMTSTRPYRRALSFDHAIREMRAVAGTQLNPVVVEKFVAIVTEHRKQALAGQPAGAHAHVFEQAVAAVKAN